MATSRTIASRCRVAFASASGSSWHPNQLLGTHAAPIAAMVDRMNTAERRSDASPLDLGSDDDGELLVAGRAAHR